METIKKKDQFNASINKKYIYDFIRTCRLSLKNRENNKRPDLELDFDLTNIYNEMKTEFINILCKAQNFQKTMEKIGEFRDFILNNYDERVIRIDFTDINFIEFLLSLYKHEFFRYTPFADEICSILIVLTYFNQLDKRHNAAIIEFIEMLLSLLSNHSLYYSMLLIASLTDENQSSYILDNFFNIINENILYDHIDKNPVIIFHCDFFVSFLFKILETNLKQETHFKIAYFCRNLFILDISDENMANLMRVMIKLIGNNSKTIAFLVNMNVLKKLLKVVKSSKNEYLIGLSVQLLLNIATSTDKITISIMTQLSFKIFQRLLNVMKLVESSLAENCSICLSNILLNKSIKLDKTLLIKTIYTLAPMIASDRFDTMKIELLLLLRNILSHLNIQVMTEVVSNDPFLIKAVSNNIEYDIDEKIVLNALHILNSFLELDKIFELEIGTRFVKEYIEDNNLHIRLENTQYHPNKVVQSLLDYLISKYFDHNETI